MSDNARSASEALAPVLVVGATGHTGGRIVERLVRLRVPVRALVRDAEKARAVLPPQVVHFVGGLRRPGTLAAPVAGAKAVVVCACGSERHDNSPELVDYFGTGSLLREAAATGVELVVFCSSIYVSRPDHYQDLEPTSLGWKARAEELVRRSGIPYCIVRAGWLTDNA